MKTFLISLPRTRSSYLFESLQPYYEKKYGLMTPDGHSELFLEWGRNIQVYNFKTEEYNMTELYPVSHKDKMQIHFVSPPIFDSTEKRNDNKLSVLKKERSKGREYNIKGTLNLASNIEQICEFYSDRKIILTKRHDKEAMIMSFLFAWESKLFHARHHNKDRYNEALSNGVTVGNDIVFDYIDWLDQMDIIETHLKENNINHEVVMYEDLTSDNAISDIIGTDKWIQYRNEKDLPIRIDKDYRKVIHNYEEVLEILKGFKVL